MTNDGHRLVWLNSQIEVAQNGLLSGGVPEPDILELDTTMSDVLDAFLLGINFRWLFNDAEDKLGRLLRFRN